MSFSITCAMFGRSTLTATGVPSGSSAKWTCATDALAMGVGSNERNTDVDGLAVQPRQRRQHLLEGKRRHAVLQLRELVGDVHREEVAPGGEHLAELDEDRAELFEREPQPLCGGRRGVAPERQRPRQRPHRAEPFVAGQELVEPVLEGYNDDDREAREAHPVDCK